MPPSFLLKACSGTDRSAAVKIYTIDNELKTLINRSWKIAGSWDGFRRSKFNFKVRYP